MMGLITLFYSKSIPCLTETIAFGVIMSLQCSGIVMTFGAFMAKYDDPFFENGKTPLAQSQIQFRISANDKLDFEKLCEREGFTISVALRRFIKNSIKHQEIKF